MSRSGGPSSSPGSEGDALLRISGQGFARSQQQSTCASCSSSGSSCSGQHSPANASLCLHSLSSQTEEGEGFWSDEASPMQEDCAEDPEEARQRVLSHGFLEHGCRHYKRRCKLVAPCCDEVFWCRHCHNDVKNANEYDPERRHELDRTQVREVVCAMCDTRQHVATECVSCGVSFGAYACLTCRFFDDDLSRGQFHCNDCGICRVGGQDKFFHCNTCGCCYSKSLENNHICVENSMRQNCPVCFEYLFDSVRATAVLPCGHTIHSDCLKELERYCQTTCPTCKKSYKDMSLDWQRIDEDVAATPMPMEYSSWQVSLLCNDCNSQGVVPFHIIGLKCPTCSSYNTSRMALHRGPSPIPDSLPPSHVH